MPFTFKKYYNYTEINTIINRIYYSKNSNLVLYNEFREFYKNNNYFINLFKILQKKKRLPHIPTEILQYILELKYNLNNQEDLGVLLFLNEAIQSELSSNYNHSMFTFRLYDFAVIYKYNEIDNYYLDIGLKPMGMGHLLKLCIDKKKRKFFFRMSGGEYHEYIYNEKIMETLNQNEKYDEYLFNFKEITDKLQKLHLNSNLSINKKYNIQKDVLQINL